MPANTSASPAFRKQPAVSPPLRGAGMTAGSLLSVTLAEDEDVLWHWTHHQDGRSVVT